MSGLGPEPGDPLPGNGFAIAPGSPLCSLPWGLVSHLCLVARCLARHAAFRGTLPIPTARAGLGKLLSIGAFGRTCARAGGCGRATSLDEGCRFVKIWTSLKKILCFLWERHPAAWDCPGLPVSDLVVPAGSDGGAGRTTFPFFSFFVFDTY